ncbi:MAG: hypothetical protein SFZ23_04990 [Planctomycetota bacterium]|nr:hypothetical protein [Planctomycetota bacterium]
MIQLPNVKPGRWRLRDAYLDGANGFIACSAAVFAALKQPSSWAITVSIALAVLALSITIVKVRRSLAKERRYEPIHEPKEIVGWARGCYELLEQTLDPATGFDSGDVRLTVYRVDYDRRGSEPTQLQQIISYVGGAGGPVARFVPARVGTIGLAARSGECIAAERSATDLDEFRAEMVEHWGYTKEEARQLSNDRFSFLAYPVRESEDGSVVAVVFFDSRRSGFFADADVQEAVVRQCGVFANIVRQCYDS